MNSVPSSAGLSAVRCTDETPIYRANRSCRVTSNSTNNYQHYSHIPSTLENTHLSQKQYSYTVNQRRGHANNPRQHINVETTSRLYGKSFSTAYYDRVRAQVYLNTPMHSQLKSAFLPPKPSTPQETPPKTSSDNEDPPLDYPNYTIDSLIQRLVPTDTYKPKVTFINPMLMCSRLHIRPSILLNKLACLSINSLRESTHDQGVRIMTNFLEILSHWTETFPYDFRNDEMISQLEELLRKLNSYEPSFRSITKRIDKQLRSELSKLDDYEDYIRQLNKMSSKSLNQMTLNTNIIDQCSTPILFAEQVTHIELSRLKAIGAEEILQYFITKSANEDARAETKEIKASGQLKSSQVAHDIKLTFNFETYIQWFNRLTFFVATEIVKHTQRRLRIQLITYFIDAAYHCLLLNNFNSMFAILGGLNMQPVKRLTRTWAKVSLEKFTQLEQFKNVSKNFTYYRTQLKRAMENARTRQWQVDRIVIPFTSLVSQDVYFIKTRSKNYTTEGGINLQKYYSISKCVLEEFIQCQQSNCSFQRNDQIINFIITSPTFSEDALMLASFECEPATTAYEMKTLAELQSKNQ
ncbi:unnamed protein product [Adineta ricciae]|uniref:Uncharacterized protein n=1 Tax=Adineta ricciae TaxID=249248 RepID=A0A815C4V9_ADIRI|nr:unnamed protein product [Adineta ricciae]CAF1275763.1 unnamed protein product [Adineta ricciae]